MALYIDADNISYSFIPNILNNIKSDLCIKKIYCDWSKNESKNCAKIINDYGLEAIQCFRLGRKQSTDIKLITDVIYDMTIYKDIKDIYIATSDVDFIYLCQTLKKMGKKITLFNTQKSLLSKFVDNTINLKNIEIDDVYNLIDNEIKDIISLKKLKQRLFKKYDINIEYEDIISILDSNFYCLERQDKIKYIINLEKLKNIKNFKKSESFKKLFDILSRKEIDKILNLII